ncbi:uncharacterized protein LOC116602178 [Nematostella vectensis]|uniref:uncharacterized protein LOC116602178 n=1 Tax=Nematostella vectensis TaxID=45351 RepID=UPI00207717AD|nr:uncharacterized protein LOC116602178 [Nematostella vectensis]
MNKFAAFSCRSRRFANGNSNGDCTTNGITCLAGDTCQTTTTGKTVAKTCTLKSACELAKTTCEQSGGTCSTECCNTDLCNSGLTAKPMLISLFVPILLFLRSL